MLWTILVILIVLWLLGFVMKIGGGLIHLILVIALIILVIQLVTGRRLLVYGALARGQRTDLSKRAIDSGPLSGI